MKVSNNNNTPPAISLPEKFVDPILIAINSLPNILNINSKLFSPTLTSTDFFFIFCHFFICCLKLSNTSSILGSFEFGLCKHL